MVYPACAGIDLNLPAVDSYTVGLPRMRGDRPWGVDVITKEDEFTPHARGSTVLLRVFLDLYWVYPACAGIDPKKISKVQ